MRQTAQEINAKLAHLSDDSQDLKDQLAQNEYEIAKLQTQLEYLNSPPVVEALKLEFPSDEVAKQFEKVSLADDGDGSVIADATCCGSAVMLAYTAKEAVYRATERFIKMAEEAGGYIPTVLTQYDSNTLESLRIRVREYVYGDAPDCESEDQSAS